MDKAFVVRPADSPFSLGKFEECKKCVQIQTTRGTENLFLKSLTVWINKPHVVNRRLCGSKIIHISRVQHQEDVGFAVQKWKEAATEKEINCPFTDLVAEKQPFTVIIRELIPKSEFFPKLIEAIVYDKKNVCVSFIPLLQDCTTKNEIIRPTEELEYHVKFREMDKDFPAWAQVSEMVLEWSCDHTEEKEPRRQMTSHWLKSVLLDKLVNWSQVNDISTSATSLQLVAVDRYKDVYVRLKNTYGRDLVKNWTERTDPKKFVYEDVAIAAYLLLIWEEERERKNLDRKQSFVDLGCGNGLLVYILTKEGHKGLGIDLRSRKIWDTFGPDIDLKEEAISPSADHLFPDYDWIIGNHSDELTPWIPVIAARSSYSCNFFVLPCCHHDFVGKFGLSEKGKSRYASYIDYVREIITFCGFSPECDTLRIPSTKRICFIGRQRTYRKQHETVIDRELTAYIDKRIKHSQTFLTQRQKVSHPLGMNSGQTTSINEDCLSSQSSKDSTLLSSEGNSQSSSQTILDSDMVLTDDDDIVTDSGNTASTSVSCFDGRECDILCSFVSSKTCKTLQKEGLPSASGDKRKLPDEHNRFSLNPEITCSERNKPHLVKRLKSAWETEDDNDIVVDGESCTLRNISKSPINIDPGQKVTGSKNLPQWAQNFQPRLEHGVRNCQRVPEETKEKIVCRVFGLVLHSKNSQVIELENGGSWKKGGSVPLGDVADLFEKCTLQELKSECGGLQTLLRNHSHIFQVTGGHVKLRDFTKPDPWEGRNPKKVKNRQGKERDTRKTTLCWFDAHHPDGCPRNSQECSFAHGQAELREKDDKRD